MAITTGNGSVGFGALTPEERRNDPWYSSAMGHEENMMNSFLPTYDESLHADMVSPQRELIDMLHELQNMDGNLTGDMSTFRSAEEYIGNLSDDACRAYIAMIDMAEGSDLDLSGAVVANDIIAYATGADPVPESVLAQQDNIFYAAMLAGYDSPDLRLDGGNGNPITSDNWDKKQDDVYSQLNSMYDATAHPGLYNSDGALNTMRTEEYIIGYLVESGWPEENMRQVVEGMEADEMTAYIALIDAAGKEPQVVSSTEVGRIIQSMTLNYGERDDYTVMPQARIDELSTLLFVDSLRDERNGITVLDHIDFSEETPTVEEQEVEEPETPVVEDEVEEQPETDSVEVDNGTVTPSAEALAVADIMNSDPAAFSAFIAELDIIPADGIVYNDVEISVADLKAGLQVYVDSRDIDFDVSDYLNGTTQGFGDSNAAQAAQRTELMYLLDGSGTIDGMTFTEIGDLTAVTVDVDNDSPDASDNTDSLYDMMMADPENFIANLQTATYNGGGIAEFAGEEVEVAALKDAVQTYLDANGIDLNISSAASQMQSGQHGGQDQLDMYIVEIMSGNASIDGQDLTEVLTEAFEDQMSVEVDNTDVEPENGGADEYVDDTGAENEDVNTYSSSDYEIACTRAAYDVLIYHSGGNGADRAAWCESQGLAYEDVQSMVNQIYNEAHATGSTYMDMRDAFEVSVAGGDYEITDETVDVNNGSPTSGNTNGHTVDHGVGYIDYMVASGIDDGVKDQGSYVISSEDEVSAVIAYVEAVDAYGGIDQFMTDLTDAYENGSTDDFIASLDSAELSGYAGYLTSVADSVDNLSMNAIADEVINDSHPNAESAYEQLKDTDYDYEV